MERQQRNPIITFIIRNHSSNVFKYKTIKNRNNYDDLV